MKPMKTNPSTRDILMQLQLHTTVFKGTNCSAFSQQPRAATATRRDEAGSISQTPPSSTSSDPRNSRLLHAIHLTSTPDLPKTSCCRFVFPDPPGGQTFTAAAATATMPHIRRPPDFLYGGRTQREAGRDGSCLAAAV